jgi:hypothetical protein
MSKQLYEEALADAKKLKEIAEDNAKRALVEAVTPRIRDLIERELLRESGGMDELDEAEFNLGEPGGIPPEGDLMTDEMSPGCGTPAPRMDLGVPGAPVEPPMFGDLAMDDADEFELDIHDEAQPSFGPLDPFMASSNATLGGQLKKLGEGIKGVKYSMRFLKESRDRSPQIGKLISQVEAMYEHVQESVSDPRKKNEYELTLEAFYKELNQLQEQNMRNNRLRRLHEKKLAFSLEIPGLGDDVSLDDVTIEITPEDGEEGEDAPADEAPASTDG